ncbi:MAG: pyridoxamine 5'-phosphate oxidase family protein [Fibrella sp.]|nr:pyridoxamine 5'-phosphate oxidase family protein [Armatimonadota bacterium]
MSSVYHAGEIEAQTRAGVREMAKRAGNGIHDAFLPGTAAFLARQPMVIVGSSDRAGNVWASALTGEPGFARAVDERTTRISATPHRGDPLSALLAPGPHNPVPRLELGILAIDLGTRERVRINGAAEVEPDGQLLVHTREVYFNCPKHIQKREVIPGVPFIPAPGAGDRITRAKVLSREQREWVAAADTFFIASAGPGGEADASHRGGSPGFVSVRDATNLAWPDYDGNTMFNTLGNITSNPNAGLLFIDFDSGDTLQLTGQATVVWEPKAAAHRQGAERVVEFRILSAIQSPRAVPLNFRFLQYSRFNPA